jgi:hypothetical protein
MIRGGAYKLVFLGDFGLGKDAALPVRPKVIDGSNGIGIMSLYLNLELSLIHIQPINFLKRHHIPIL